MADCDRFISDAPYIMDKGLINYAIQGEYQISGKNYLRAAVRYLMTAEDLEFNNESDDDLGYELDLWYAYTLNKHVDLIIDAAEVYQNMRVVWVNLLGQGKYLPGLRDIIRIKI